MFDTSVVFFKREPFIQCKNCLMDTSDSAISFDEEGICVYCTETPNYINKDWYPNELGESILLSKIDEIKYKFKDKPFDSIVGISGGIDSSWVALKSFELGLRPLLFHVDAGWNSDVALKNIHNLCNYLNADLQTYVVNWNQMKKLQIAFLKSGVLNQDIPQDHVFFSSLVNVSKKMGNLPIINGFNFASESITPISWGYTSRDGKFVKSIAFKFGYFYPYKLPIKKVLDFVNSNLITLSPLNYTNYNPITAEKTMTNLFGWSSYQVKHYESDFTKWFQGYYLLKKANIDKRKAHLSSLIISGKVTKNEAKKILENPPLTNSEITETNLIVCDKLGVSQKELNNFIVSPIRNSYSIRNDSLQLKYL